MVNSSTRVNWFSVDEITAELSIVEARRQHNRYYSLDTFSFPSEPFHFLSLVGNEHLHQNVSAPLQQCHNVIVFIPLLGEVGAAEAATHSCLSLAELRGGAGALLSRMPGWRGISTPKDPLQWLAGDLLTSMAFLFP